MNNMREAFNKVGIQGNAPESVPETQKKEQKRVGKDLPENYVDEAEKIMRSLGKEYKPGQYGFSLTTSKLRNLLTLVSDIYSHEIRSNRQELSEDNIKKLQLVRIRMLYESGRERSVKNLVVKAKLLEYLNNIGQNRLKFLDYYHYMEALVAYHRYLGGKDA